MNGLPEPDARELITTEDVTRALAGGNGHNPSEKASPWHEALTSLPADHDGHAACLVLLYPNRFLYCPSYGWMHNTGNYWERDGAEERVERAALDVIRKRRDASDNNKQLDDLYKACKGNAYNINGIKTALREKVLVSVKDFDSDPDLLNCKNGVIHLPSGELLKRAPNHLFTYCVAVDYDPQAEAEPWIDFLLAAVDGNGDFMNYIQAAAGYSLTGHTREEVLFYLYGPTRSGKGTFIEAMLELLGRRPLASEETFTTFTADQDRDTQNFALAPLKACRFVAASESNKYNALNPAKIKTITGGNDITCAYKHRDSFTYRPQFKLWLVSNHPVNTDVDDDAAWGRVKVILFPVSHLGNEDKALKWQLKQPENLRGVLRWAVEGARLWYAMPHGLEDPPALKAETARHRAEADYLAAFLEECTEPAEGEFIANKTLYTLYETWCKETGVEPKKQRLFSQGMKRKGYRDGQKKVIGINMRGFYGLQTVTVTDSNGKYP